MRLIDLVRTSGFRTGLFFLALFGGASLLLFAVIYQQSAGYMSRQTDDWLAHEVTGRIADTPAALDARLKIRRQADPGQRRPFALFTPDGRLIAGNLDHMPAIPAFDRPFEFRTRTSEDKPVAYRAMAHDMGGQRTLIIAQDVDELEDFSEQLLHALLLAGGLMVAVGIGGAVVLGIGSARRIDLMRRAIERIVGGDLSERLPAGQGRGDIDRLAAVVNGMLDELERLVDEVKGVCDNIAHDMRTPLGRLLGGLERARRREPAEGALGSAVDGAIGEVKSILRLFGALLRISEIEDGMRRSGFADIDLAAIGADAVDYHSPAAEAQGIALSIDAPPSLAFHGDPGLMFEALGNLIDNAIKFTPAGGHVALSITPGPIIRISDDGPGIPAAERQSVLARFRRGEASRGFPGNGLGLALVAAVARLHRLELHIGDDRPGCVISLIGTPQDHPVSRRNPIHAIQA